MTDTTKGLVALMLIAALAIGVGAIIGRTRAEAAVATEVSREPVVYLISVSRVAYPDEDVWLVRYALDGVPCATDVPIRNGEPDGYLEYLAAIGRIYK